MVEIVLIYFLCKAIGDTLAKKGRMAIGYQVLAAVLWFVGEIGAAVCYGVVVAVSGGDVDSIVDINAYLISLSGALAGGGIAFLIAHMVPPAADPLFDAASAYGMMPGAAHPAAPQNPYEGFDEASSNLSSAKYLQNYSSNG